MSSQHIFDLSGKVAAVIDIKQVEAARVTAAAEAEGCTCEAAGLDIRDSAAVEASFSGIAKRYGALDIVICTPSINVRKKILDYNDDELSRVLELNIKGNFNVLRAAGRIMTAQRRGSIVLFSSIRSLVVEPGQSVYAATKAGIVQLARTAASEFGPFGVRVNCVGPGVIETPLTAPIKNNQAWFDAYAAKSAFNRWGTAEEMVGPTLFLASDAASFVTGTILYADGGWLAQDGRFTPPGM
jgi:NAD(P)-dependent dehydrogenase (short-subunit alcohol dehydrogenase family)